MKRTKLLSCLALGLLCLPAAMGASPGPVQAGLAERWAYPRGGRNPLAPPEDLYVGQDIPGLVVTVIGYDRARPERSLAVVRMESRPPVRKVVRVGDRVGEYRVLRIAPDRIVASVPTLGSTTQVELLLRDSTANAQ